MVTKAKARKMRRDAMRREEAQWHRVLGKIEISLTLRMAKEWADSPSDFVKGGVGKLGS